MQRAKTESSPPFVVESLGLLSESKPNPLITKPNVKVSKKTRTILWYTSFLGFIINSMIRLSLNIAIVSMVVPRNATYSNKSAATECFNRTSMFVDVKESGQSVNNNYIKKGFSIERSVMDLFKIPYNENGFNWNEYEQGLTLGSFYWLYWTTQLLGGYLAKRYGTKFVFGMSNFVACALSSLIPIAAYLNLNSLICLRVIQGIVNGFAFPSMHNIISGYIPPNERGRFISAYMGGSLAYVIFYPVFGFIITISSWEWVFHFCTVSGIVWFILWQYFVYDSPSEHPRIDLSEFNYITEAVGDSVQKDSKDIPWKSILTSSPFWLTVVAHWGCLWQTITLTIQLPTYYKFIHGLDYQVLGILSGAPHILRMGFSYAFAMFIDYMLSTKKSTRTNARKLAVFFTCIIAGISTILLAYVACDHVMAVVFSSISIALLGGQSSSSLASLVDLAPNYSSLLLGLATTICVLTGTFSSHVVGVLTNNRQTIQQWNYVFLISAGMGIGCGTVYILFASSEEQSWNKICKAREMEPLTEIKLKHMNEQNAK